MVLSIELDDNIWVYAPGQTIKGKVVINKNIWNKVEGLSIRFYGRIEIGTHNPGVSNSGPPISAQGDGDAVSPSCWTSARRLVRKSEVVENVLLDHTINLLDSWKVLKPGRHEFNFCYELPVDIMLPQSMKVNGAKIHYEFVTSLKRPRDDFKVYQTPFYIYPPDDEYSKMNYEEFMHPVVNKCNIIVSQLWGCCMKSNFGLQITLERRLCSVGGVLPFIVTVWNELNTNLDFVSIMLIRRFKFKKAPFTSTKEVVCEVIGPALMSRDSQVWNGSLSIPSNTPATSVVRCDLFELNYYVKIRVHPLIRPSKELSLKFPVLVLPVHVYNIMSRIAAISPEFNSYDSGNCGGDSPPPPTYDDAMTQYAFQ